jgi:hypothetical protein
MARQYVRIREPKTWGTANPRHDDCRAPEHASGTQNGYGNFMCRCPDCREAHRIYTSMWRKDKKRKP